MMDQDDIDELKMARAPQAVQFEHLRGKIRGVERDQQNHEDICAQRYAGIREDIGGLNRRISWAGGIVVAVVLSVLGWSLNSQWETAQQTQRTLIAIEQGARAAPSPSAATTQSLPSAGALPHN